MVTADRTLAEVSEEGLLHSIFPFFAARPALLVGPGDDAAVVAAGSAVVATTDSMVRGRDWLDDWSTAADVGAKVLTQNLADVAAMGGVTTSVLITLVADPATPADWARDLARSIGERAALAGVAVAGGDLSSAPAGVLVVSVTALGDLEGRPPVLRSGARPGDLVALAGTLGRSAAGLALLERGEPGEPGEPGEASEPRGASEPGSRPATPAGAGDGGAGSRGIRQGCLEHHLRPTSPVAEGPRAARAGATAMIDVSDGLLRDADRVARASGVELALHSAALEAHVAPLAEVLGPEAALECVLAGGEEHSLLATFPPGAVPEGWQVLGEVRAVPAGVAGQVSLDDVPQRPRGWDHFAG
jgi:thiamine-monophosphate kinase